MKIFGDRLKVIGVHIARQHMEEMDEICGPVIERVAKVVDLVYTKYLKALISYEGITRIEKFMFSRDAFREIVLNAIVHKDYSSCNPIQISVYPDKIYVWNNGNVPKNLDSAEKLFGKHSSEPFNPNLAQVFFKSGLIEAWGRDFDKIRAGCEEYGGELPAIMSDAVVANVRKNFPFAYVRNYGYNRLISMRM